MVQKRVLVCTSVIQYQFFVRTCVPVGGGSQHSQVMKGIKYLSSATKYYVSRHSCSKLKSNLITQESNLEFRNSVIKIVCKTVDDYVPTLPADTKENMKRLTEESLMNKNSFRGPLALFAYEHLEKPENVTKDSLIKMPILGWGADVVDSYFTLLEEKQDGSNSIDDASLLRSLLYEVLKKRFVGYASLKDIVDVFDKAFLYTSIGTHLDTITSKPKDYNAFSMNRYNDIVDHKSYGAFKMPVYLAMSVANKGDQYSVLRVDGVCTDIGRVAHIQNDFLNCYGDVDITGPKSDIRNGKCTWLALTALQRCTPAQRKVFTACYGSAEPAHIERVKRLYDQLEIAKLYKEHQKLLQNGIQAKAQGLANANISPEPFMRVLEELLLEL